MARTYHKSAMEDISLFSTETGLEELGLFDSLSFPGESDFLPNYDVYNCIEETKPPLPNLWAEDLLEELDFQDGNSLLDCNWMTEKLEFNTTDPVLAVEPESLQFSTSESVLVVETSPAMDVDSADLTSLAVEPPTADEPTESTTLEALEPQTEGNIFAGVEEILKRLCADRKIPYSEGNTSAPSSPLQNVPEVDVHSPCSVPSPGSDVSENTLQLPQVESDGENVSCLSSPSIQTTLVKAKVQLIKTQPKATCFSPYPKEKPVKSPLQKKRKREQNKDAATRYRVKKREEQDCIQKELAGLEKENVELKDQMTSLSKEIEYLKNLMLEVCKNKLQKQAMMSLKVK